MKPSDFLKDRFNEFFKDVYGEETVTFFSFIATSGAQTTGTVDEATAYPETGIDLPCKIIYSPSDGLRKKLGLEQNFDAALLITADALSIAGITVKFGDAFLLPGISNKLYVLKAFKSRQYNDEFLDLTVAVNRELGERL